MTLAEIQLVYHEEPDGWWAESPDVPGLFIAGKDVYEVNGLLLETLSSAYAEGYTVGKVKFESHRRRGRRPSFGARRRAGGGV
ncbi:MAG: hypothetical protein AMXMBFR33_01910 [Candidatus Xenobia bacterium]